MDKEEYNKYKFSLYFKTHGPRRSNPKIHLMRNSDATVLCTNNNGWHGYEFGNNLLEIKKETGEIFYGELNRDYYMEVPTKMQWCCKKCLKAIEGESLKD